VVTPALSRLRDVAPVQHRVIAAPPGVDQIKAADRAFRELRGQGGTVHVTVKGNVLRRSVRDRLPFEARRNGVLTYHAYTRDLWKSVLTTEPELIDRYSVDLWEFRERLRSRIIRPLRHRQVVVVQGQQLPVEFYSLLRLIGVDTTVFVDPVQSVDEEESTLGEIAEALGVQAPMVLRQSDSPTDAIHEFVEYFAHGTTGFACERPRRRGSRPVLINHRDLDDEISFVVDYATEHAGQRVGVLFQTSDLVRTFADEVGARFTGLTQWYLSGDKSPERAVVDDRAGVKVLTWSSAYGLEFDRVVLASLDRVANEFQVETAVRVLGPAARAELVLSYSGQGEPTALEHLPKSLMDDRTRLFDGLPPRVPTGRESVAGPKPGVAEPEVFAPKSPAEIARDLLAADQAGAPDRHRVLTAVEEVGLAELMRGGAAELSEELPRGFRSTLDANDERARAFDALVHHNVGLVQSNIRRHLGSDLEEDDLFQHGVLGLMRAVEKFDASMGNKFSTYATHWINQSMSRAVADEGALIRIPVFMHEKVRKVLAVQADLLRTNEKSSVAEVCKRTEFKPADVVLCLKLAVRALRLDAPLPGTSDTVFGEFLHIASDQSSNPDHVLDQRVGIDLVHRALSMLKEREADVLRLRFGLHGGDDLTLEKIGEQFKVTRERIRQIESKAKVNIVAKLAEVGLTGDGEGRPSPPPTKSPKKPTKPFVAPEGSPRTGRADGVLASGWRSLAELGVQNGGGSVAGLVNVLVDRALDAGAQDIRITSAGEGTSSWLVITHDGNPFMAEVLRSVLMRDPALVGSGEAAGTVGLALSLYDEVVTWSSAKDDCLVLTAGANTDMWWLRRGTGSTPRGLLTPDEAGTRSVVLLRAPQPKVARMHVGDVLERHAHRLGFLLGELLTGTTSIRVDGKRVTRRDPFLWHNSASQDLGDEHVRAGGHTAVVGPRVLPHPELLRPEDAHSAGDPASWFGQQGFYVRSGGRYLTGGGWLGLGDLDLSPDTALARVLVEIDPVERTAWGFDRADGVITPPEPLRARLTALAEMARRRSQLVLGRNRTGAVT
jgi:RNA polymerase sigma factor (sigma-70 family)